MRRLLMVSPTAAPGGAERVFVDLASRLPDLGWTPHVVLLEEGPLEGWLASRGLASEVIGAGRLRQLHRTGAMIGRLAVLARRVDAAAVFANQTKGHLYAGPATHLSRRPVLWWQHGIPDGSVMDRLAASIPCARIVCGSRASREAQLRLSPSRSCVRIQPGIEVDDVQARRGEGVRIRERLGWGEEPVVGIVGRLQPWKGQDVFLRAMGKVSGGPSRGAVRRRRGAVLGWEGDYPDDLRRLSLELGIGDHTHFAGHQEDVYPWFDALDVVVHASFGEPFGLVLVEAMALGKPVVASASGGPSEIVEDGVSGILYPPGDHATLADEVVGLLGDAERRRRIGNAARRRAQRFSRADDGQLLRPAGPDRRS